MSDPHAQHGHGPSPALPFTPADWDSFKRDDILAGRAVIILMTAIFSIGVVLYSIVLSAVLF